MLYKGKSQEKQEFNNLAYIYPPDLQKSQKHRLANRIFRKININQQLIDQCECCGRYIGQQQDAGTYCYDPLKQLSYLGPGLPLLFKFSQNVIIFEVVLITMVSILALILNALTNSCSSKCSIQNIFSLLSLSNNANNFQLLVAMTFVFTIIWVFMNQLFIYRCRDAEFQADEEKVTPSDFAIFLLDLPDHTTREDIEQMLDRKRKVIKARLKLQNLSEEKRSVLTEANDFKIQMIIFPYKIAEYLKEERQQEEEYIRFIKEQRGQKFQKKPIKLPQNLANLAIIVFEKEITKSVFLEKDSFYDEIKQFFCNGGGEPNFISVKEKKISVVRASEPDDIIWQNIELSYRDILLNKVTTTVFAILVLLIGGIIQYWLAVWQLKSTDKNLHNFVVAVSAIIVTFSNFLLSLMLIWATKKEGNITKSKYNASLTLKICLFQFFNSGLFYTISNLVAINLTENNVNQNMQEMFASKATVCMIVDAATQGLIILLIGVCQLPNSFLRFLMNQGFYLCSQKRSNEIHELNDCDIPEKYAFLIKTLWLSCFYTPFVPLVGLISFVGLVFFYMAVKISFRHFYKITSVRSNQTNMRALRLSFFGPFMLNLGLLVIQLFYSSYHSKELFDPESTSIFLTYFSLAISIVYGFLPWYHINEAVRPLKNKSNFRYSEVKKCFEMAYDDVLLNPFEDKHMLKSKEKYFLLNQVRRQSKQKVIDFQPFFNKFLKTSTDLESGERIMTCRKLVSDPLMSDRVR